MACGFGDSRFGDGSRAGCSGDDSCSPGRDRGVQLKGFVPSGFVPPGRAALPSGFGLSCFDATGGSTCIPDSTPKMLTVFYIRLIPRSKSLKALK